VRDKVEAADEQAGANRPLKETSAGHGEVHKFSELRTKRARREAKNEFSISFFAALPSVCLHREHEDDLC
jgi:hypothetical protein